MSPPFIHTHRPQDNKRCMSSYLVIVVHVRSLDGYEMANLPVGSEIGARHVFLTSVKQHVPQLDVPSLAYHRRYLHVLLYAVARLLPGKINALPLLDRV